MHRAERTDALVEALGALVSEPFADPFALEVVAVPTRGVERWISQRLSHLLGAVDGQGICAGVLFPSPAQLVAQVVVGPQETDPETSAWSSSRLPWAVLDVLDMALAVDDPAMVVVRGYLERSASTTAPDGVTWSHRRFAAAAEIARLLESYATQRPAMLRDWAMGRDHDGAGHDLPPDLAWQAEVFRRVRAHVDTPSPAEVLPGVVAALRDDPAISPLPGRVSVFGPTRLSTAEIEVMSALSEHRDVHMFLPHPSPALWTAVDQMMAVSRSPTRLRDDDATRRAARLPLLESLGRDSRELQVRLQSLLPVDDVRVQHHGRADPRPPTLLGRLQQVVADDAEPSALSPRPLSQDDFSVQVHACHGLARQVEVLRELLVGMLADDPSLEPRDIVVMCPDVESIAPLVTASFGRSTVADQPLGHPGHRLRVKVADRSVLASNMMLGLLDHLLSLADSRCTLDEVLGLLALQPVRRRFRWDDEDLERITQWLPQVGVRWGLNALHRGRYGLAGVADHTWQAGLDRLLLGVAVSEDGLPLVGEVLPFDGVASGQVELVGGLSEAVERIGLVLADLQGPQPLSRWLQALERGLDLLADVDADHEWQDTAARRVLADVLAEAGGSAAVMLALADVRVLLRDRLAGRPTRANFRTGDLTVCSLAPMRSVPHRVVVLLGLDDDAYPRSGSVRGDDVLQRRAFVGDRDVRSEDRQILLDAVHAATERLVVLFTGMNPRTNAPEPPAVPVAELLDTLHALVDRADHSRLIVRHPLQPFDERALVTSGTERPLTTAAERPFAFDPAMLETAQAARGDRREPARLCEAQLPPVAPAPTVEMRDLVQMLENPAKGLLRQRLDLATPDEFRIPPARLTQPLDGLQTWHLGDRLLRQRMSGWGEGSVRAETARGDLPVAPLGDLVLAAVRTDAATVADAALRSGVVRTESRQVVARLTDTRVIVGTANVMQDEDEGQGTVVLVTYSKPKVAHLMRVWVAQLMLCVAEPRVRWSARVVDRGQGVTIPPVASREAAALLGQLLDVRESGLCRALPMPANAASAFARSELVNPGSDPQIDAMRAFRVDSGDDSWQRVWGDRMTFRDILAAQPPDELSPPSNGSWFALLARTVWGPVHEARLGGVAP